MLIGQQVTVLGAGVAGLTVACALARRGADVTVLEQADAVRAVGAGLQVSPNGAAVLRALGLGPALDAASLAATGVQLTDGRTGRAVLRLPFTGRDFRLIHRADLIALLAAGAAEAGVRVALGQKVQKVEPGPEPRVTLDGGSVLEQPLLIGADGLHSVVRAALNGARAPDFTGQVAWRAIIPASPGESPVAEVHMGPGRHLVSYPLPGGRRNIVGVEERRQWAAESWSQADDPGNLRAAFAGFAPRVQGWLARVETVHLWGLFRHPVARQWHGPGMAILGDAAHPTLPFLAQGANMALEDAWVLAAALAGHDTASAALAAYQQARHARTTRIVVASGRNARAYHLTAPWRQVAHAGLRLAGRIAPDLPLRRFDWLYGCDVTA